MKDSSSLERLSVESDPTPINKRRNLARRGTSVEPASYRHSEKRTNNPDAGLATYNFKTSNRKAYSYDAHLDPQLVWAGKAEHLSFEVDTLSLHIHERISTLAILKSVQHERQWRQLRLFAEPELPLDRRIEFYQHEMDWANRLILGDSLLVMNSLLQRELMAGKIQMIYIDPPYGIGYDSNFQPFVSRVEVRDGQDESLTREPEQVKAYRDTWTLGIHSYLTYLRDRVMVSHDLLSETGSVFVQISQENLHYVTCILDEVFGRTNFVALVAFRKKQMPLGARFLDSICDYLVWYAKDKPSMKYHQLYIEKRDEGDHAWSWVELPDGIRRRMTSQEIENHTLLPKGSRVFQSKSLRPAGFNASCVFQVKFQGRTYNPPGSWGDERGRHEAIDFS